MSCVRKLMVRGIRSFSPREDNAVEFYSPLTLIVGANGTGKTTIIESLKYVTTGSLPPNSRGGAFIYDPRVARTAEVRGQVKLLFTNVHGESMVCSRSVQLTHKRDKKEQKTLESAVWAERDGAGGGGRGADVDAEMPRHFGVPGSVLENIIFCHQEEGTWPLGEPVTVKKRLDDIFASVRYSKALDSLKVCKKECLSDVKLKMQELEFLRKMKERREALEARVRSSSLAIERNEARLEAYDNEVRRCEGVLGEIEAEMRSNEETERKVYALRGEYKEAMEFVKGFKGRRLPLCEAQEVLCDGSLQRIEEEHRKAVVEAEEGEGRLRELSEERSRYLRSKGELDGVFAEMSVRSSQLDEARRKRAEALQSLESELRVKEGFRETAASVFENVERDIRKRREAVRELEERLVELRREDGNRMAGLEEKMKMIREYEGLESDWGIDVSVSYESELERLVGEVDGDKELEALEERLDEYQRRLSKAYSVAEANFVMGQLRDRKKEIEGMLRGVNVPELRGKLERQRKELREKEERTKRMEKEMHLRRAEAMQREKENGRIGRELWKKSMELGGLASRCPTPLLLRLGVPTVRVAGESSVESAKQVVRCNGDFFTGEVLVFGADGLDLEEVYDKAELCKLLGEECDVGGRSRMYLSLLQQGCRDHKCPVCNRVLSPSEEAVLKRGLENRVGCLEDGKENDREGVVDGDEALRELETANKEIECRNGVRKEMAELILRYERNVDVEDDGVLEEMELDILDDLSEVKKTEMHVGLVEEMFSIEGKMVDEEVGESVQELKAMIDGVRKMYENKKAEIREKRERIAELSRKQSVIEAEREVRANIGSRERALAAVRGVDAGSMRARIEGAECEVVERRARLDRIVEKFARKRVELEMNMEAFYAKEKEVRELERDVEGLGERSRRLLQAGFSDEAKDEGRFDLARNNLLDKKSRVLELGRRMQAMREMQDVAEQSMRYHSKLKRAEEIEKELGAVDLAYLDALKEKRKLLEEKKVKLVAQRSLLLGECKQIALGIKACKQELEKDHGATVENYNKCFIEVKALEMSCMDVDKCIQALDRAIVDFHTSKLEEVNATLKDLWTNTYKGSDIDWIEIRTESCGQKTYNYKVVFVKGGAELDMRGRCSAGQKMVASILIRLALADSFATNCSVLALDEPTTNLDRDNIESLAFTLSRVISRHKKNKDFQLIVITHDEDFVQLLSRDGPEYFYRLSRDKNGDSTIIRHSVYGAQDPGQPK